MTTRKSTRQRRRRRPIYYAIFKGGDGCDGCPPSIEYFGKRKDAYDEYRRLVKTARYQSYTLMETKHLREFCDWTLQEGVCR